MPCVADPWRGPRRRGFRHWAGDPGRIHAGLSGTLGRGTAGRVIFTGRHLPARGSPDQPGSAADLRRESVRARTIQGSSAARPETTSPWTGKTLTHGRSLDHDTPGRQHPGAGSLCEPHRNDDRVLRLLYLRRRRYSSSRSCSSRRPTPSRRRWPRSPPSGSPSWRDRSARRCSATSAIAPAGRSRSWPRCSRWACRPWRSGSSRPMRPSA